MEDFFHTIVSFQKKEEKKEMDGISAASEGKSVSDATTCIASLYRYFVTKVFDGGLGSFCLSSFTNISNELKLNVKAHFHIISEKCHDLC